MDFNNTKLAFSYKSNSDLKNAYLLFSAINRPWLVNSLSALANLALKTGLPLWLVAKPTFYRQFVGGEHLNDCERVIDHLRTFNVHSVLDYSAEGGIDDIQADDTFREILKSIDFAAGKSYIPYTVFKPSSLIVSSVLHKYAQNPDTLTPIEVLSVQLFEERFMALCQRAFEREVRIMIDAEHYATQDVIDRITEQAMEVYNSNRAVLFHTLQMYRHDRLDYLQNLHRKARKAGYILGIKFVRGAYMQQERELAALNGYPDPINRDKEATDNCYNNGLVYVMDNIDSFELFSGTHNYESNYLLANLIDQKGLKRNDKRIYFSQLYGMSDNISFVLASEGYNVCKYVPYAPVRKVLPYLMRRAQENSSIAGQSSRELQLIKKEIKRRRSNCP